MVLAAYYYKILSLPGICSVGIHVQHTLHVQYHLGQSLFIFLLREILDTIVITSHLIAHYEFHKCRKLASSNKIPAMSRTSLK